MPYMLLIMEAPGQRRTRTLEEGRDLYDRMLRFGESLTARNLLKGGDALVSTSEAVRVSVRDGKMSVRDGPFAEAKEMVGGYFLIDCASKEEAVAIAAECPASAWATVEVREIGVCYENPE